MTAGTATKDQALCSASSDCSQQAGPESLWWGMQLPRMWGWPRREGGLPIIIPRQQASSLLALTPGLLNLGYRRGEAFLQHHPALPSLGKR